MDKFKVFIVCHTRTQYEGFMRENNLKTQQHRFTYLPDIQSLEKLRGIEEFAIIRLDGWYHHKSEFIDKLREFEIKMLSRREERGSGGIIFDP